MNQKPGQHPCYTKLYNLFVRLLGPVSVVSFGTTTWLLGRDRLHLYTAGSPPFVLVTLDPNRSSSPLTFTQLYWEPKVDQERNQTDVEVWLTENIILSQS